MAICRGGKKACVRGNSIRANKQGGLILCCSSQVLITRNSICYNGPFGVGIKETSGYLEGNRIFAHAQSGIQIEEGSKDLLIASNCCHNNDDAGISWTDEVFGRVQGNSLWSNGVGMYLAPAAKVAVTGNLFMMNDVGAFFETAGQAARAGSFGPGNVFSRSAEADFLERGADQEEREVTPAPSNAASCAHCSAAIAPGKNSCGGCSKFGSIYAPCYCGAACQRAHWPAHRAECGRAEARARMREAAFEAAADALLAYKPRREGGTGGAVPV